MNKFFLVKKNDEKTKIIIKIFGIKFTFKIPSVYFKIRKFLMNNASIYNLKALSYDIPVLYTKEQYVQNDFYYNAYILKKYCNYPLKKPLNCTIEHGIYNRLYHWDLDTENDATTILSIGEYRKEALSKVCDKKHYAIGPFIAYTESLWKPEKIQKTRKKNGKTLLVFPSHSTHHVLLKYDANAFCENILKIKEKYHFDTVLVCLYWKDILLKYNQTYKKYGFKCVCAGHIYHQNFLPRLKTILQLADVVMSNSDGTCIGYAIYMEKPVYINKQDFTRDISDCVAKNENKICKDMIELQQEQLDYEKTFYNYSETITKEQFDAVNNRYSFSKIRSKKDLFNIFTNAETLSK